MYSNLSVFMESVSKHWHQRSVFFVVYVFCNPLFTTINLLLTIVSLAVFWGQHCHPKLIAKLPSQFHGP